MSSSVKFGNIKDDMLAAKGTTNFVVAPFYNQHTITGKKKLRWHTAYCFRAVIRFFPPRTSDTCSVGTTISPI